MRPTFVVYGNCQGAVLEQSLKFIPEFSDTYETHYVRSFVHPLEGRCVIDPDIMARCKILWCQLDESAPYSFEGETPSDMRTITIPPVDLGVLWPFQTQDGIFKPETAYPYGMFPYGDRLLIRTAEEGHSGDEGMAHFETLAHEASFDFPRYLDIELARLFKREQQAHVRIASYVLSRFRTDRLFWAYNHPTKQLFAELLNRIAQATWPESRSRDSKLHRIGSRIFKEWDPFAGEFQVPVHPFVAAALDLSWWSREDRYAFHGGEFLTAQGYVERYLSERIARQSAEKSD